MSSDSDLQHVTRPSSTPDLCAASSDGTAHTDCYIDSCAYSKRWQLDRCSTPFRAVSLECRQTMTTSVSLSYSAGVLRKKCSFCNGCQQAEDTCWIS